MKILITLLGLLALGPISSQAILPTGLTPSDSSFASNTVIAITIHDGAIWLATSRGANVSIDDGNSWVLMQDAPGMVSANVSAIHSQSGRVWIATSHDQFVTDQLVSLSDGIFYSEDDGASWTQVNFGEDGLNIPYVWGGYQTVYDITGFRNELDQDDWLFFAAFAGGLVASRDNGETWRRIYASPGDSVQYNDVNQQPSLRNRYFAAAADSSHGDSVMLWTGTAGGVVQYIFSPPREKLYASDILALAACDVCADSATNYLYIGTDFGVSRVLRTGGNFITRDTADGLPGPVVTALYDFRDRLFVGTADSLYTDTTGPYPVASTGLAVSDDHGDSFMPISIPELIGMDQKITAFVAMGERLYLAAEMAGLWVTEDTGATWSQILIDSTDTGSPLNAVYDIDALNDSLYVGTDSGVVRLELAPDGSINSMTYYEFREDPFSSRGIRQLKVHQYLDSLGTSVDSTELWAVNVPMTLGGTYSVTRGRLFDPPLYDTNGAIIDTINMIPYTFLYDTTTYDIDFIGDTVYAVGDYGIRSNSTPNSSAFATGPTNVISLIDSATGTTISSDTVFVMENLKGQACFGTSAALAVQKDSTHNYRFYKLNINPLGRDVAVNHTFFNSITVEGDNAYPGLSGDFIPAMAVQYSAAGPARVWASGRPVTNGWPGISVGRYDYIDTTGQERFRWYNLLEGNYAWNFAFDGDSVTFAATNAGLLVNRTNDDSTSLQWDTVAVYNNSGLPLLEPGTPVYSVAVNGNDLWIGTGEGTIRQSLINEDDNDLYIVIDSTSPADEVYAYPVPFSPGRGEEVHFRFVTSQAAVVTIEVYDFAMNLVARPIDGVQFPAGYHESPGSPRITWDGYNGKGDLVAVGVYYFKVSYSTGEEYWGKLAVMP